jgi:hypothetical protein
MRARAAQGACTLVTRMKATSEIAPSTKVASAFVHTDSKDMPDRPHALQPSALVDHNVHDVLEGFRQAAQELRLSVRFVWVQYNLGPNESDTACVLVLWRPGHFKPNLFKTGSLLTNMMYELAPKPADGFDGIEEIYNFGQ